MHSRVIIIRGFVIWTVWRAAFYCSFYRVATLGSGAGIAAIYYFHEKEIDYSKSTGSI